MRKAPNQSKRSVEAPGRNRPEERQANEPGPEHSLVWIQRMAGNRAVVNLLESHGQLQTKLRTSEPVDEHAEQALGPTPSGPDGVALLGDSLSGFRLYPATSAAPHGLTVWFVENKIVAVQISQPHLDRPLKEQIGEPEATAPSLLKTLQTQWIYASRGLTAHVSKMSGTISSLYAYRPMTVAEFLSSSLSRVSSRRIPLR